MASVKGDLIGNCVGEKYCPQSIWTIGQGVTVSQAQICSLAQPFLETPRRWPYTAVHLQPSRLEAIAKPRPVVNLTATGNVSPSIVKRMNIDLAKLCHEAENPSSPNKINDENGAAKYLVPAREVIGQLKYRYGVEPAGDIETVVVKQPTHGKILQDVWIRNEQEFPSASYRLSVYVPDKDFYGTDRVAFAVRANGRLFRVSVKVNVVPTSLNGESCNTNDDSSSGPEVTWAVAGLK